MRDNRMSERIAALEPNDALLVEELAAHLWKKRPGWLKEPPPFAASSDHPTAASLKERGEYLTYAREALMFLRQRCAE